MIDLTKDPPMELAAAAEHAYGRIIVDGIKNHPRSQQRMIGPSEVGVPCNRALLYKLAQVPEPPDPDMDVRLEAPLGTAFHAQLEEWFGADNHRFAPGERWLVEERVEVGSIGGQPITGSTDLFDTSNGIVIDHKVVSPQRLKQYRAKGAGPQYTAQAMLYARGWAMDGYAVKGSAIAFIPRGGQIRDIYFHFMEYDEHIALTALQRAETYWTVLQTVGLDAALQLPVFAACTDQERVSQQTGRPYNKDAKWCTWCRDDHAYEVARTGRSPFHS
ncbi:hypothetical protein [Zhihengliuella flava]|uniref:Uncharacterized protein n=1 Tax=Zhihengliuella flava TaxID=1285193 RepID=A0A931D6D7_9MICC|nr:hypothetical protein [Zhihengliuella flava]MBG6083274.1 hypothetical protein [Zhihengliuella flava]